VEAGAKAAADAKIEEIIASFIVTFSSFVIKILKLDIAFSSGFAERILQPQHRLDSKKTAGWRRQNEERPIDFGRQNTSGRRRGGGRAGRTRHTPPYQWLVRSHLQPSSY